MKIRLQQSASAKTEMSVVLVAEGDAPQLPAPLSACWDAAKSTGDVKTDAQKASVFHPHAGPKRFGCVGLGKRKDVDTERLRRAAAVAQAIAEDRGVRSFELLVDDAMFGKASAEVQSRQVQRQLGVQSLSLANQQPSTLLGLFR